MSQFVREFTIVAKHGPRLYFAPLIGAYRAIKEEWRRLDAELAAIRKKHQEQRGPAKR